MANSTDLYGLYDLGDDGTILYSHDNSSKAETRPELVGRNFFEDISGFGDIPDFRLHFYSFVKSRKAVDSFIFESGNANGKTKVHMARAFENDNRIERKRVMLLIRQGA